MTTIKTLTIADFAGTEYATIIFSNGVQYFARVLDRMDSYVIIFFAGKLIRILLPSYECKVLAEGVSIR